LYPQRSRAGPWLNYKPPVVPLPLPIGRSLFLVNGKLVWGLLGLGFWQSDRSIYLFLPISSDGLARAEARGDSDADHARRVGGRCFRRRIHHRLLSDDDACIRRWSRAYYAYHCAKLALLQSPPLEVVGSERSGASSEATCELCCRFFQEESSKAQVGVTILALMSMSCCSSSLCFP
ncbi:hypothetical protein BHE74_00015354, partial [Ensete ventricosum]